MGSQSHAYAVATHNASQVRMKLHCHSAVKQTGNIHRAASHYASQVLMPTADMSARNRKATNSRVTVPASHSPTNQSQRLPLRGGTETRCRGCL